MKNILSLLLAFSATCASAATLVPVQLLNPAGSTSGQAIVSTGPSTAPAWGSVTAAALAAQAANTVVANVTASSHSPTAVSIPSCSTTNSALQYTSGTGFSCLTTSAVLGANTFTNSQSITASGNVTLNLTDTSSPATGQTRVNFNSTAGLAWGLVNSSSANQFTINRYTAGVLQDGALSISNSTGIVSMPDGLTAAGGITGSPISGSTGSFTTLAASSTITPSQTAGIVGTTTNNNVQAGSVGEVISSTIATGSAVSLTTGTPTNVTSISLTAGDWDVFGAIDFNLGTGVTVQLMTGSASTTSAALLSGSFFAYPGLAATVSTVLGSPIPMIRLSLASTTTVYLVAQTSFSGGTLTAFGNITARRRR